jgi:hypothetical protein
MFVYADAISIRILHARALLAARGGDYGFRNRKTFDER